MPLILHAHLHILPRPKSNVTLRSALAILASAVKFEYVVTGVWYQVELSQSISSSVGASQYVFVSRTLSPFLSCRRRRLTSVAFARLPIVATLTAAFGCAFAWTLF
ncbi:hypothetical protein HBI97_213340 [Parastagonospora nodorum]|nr:hypothetical protein HBI97_213340 [Parastagonospora nodorum]